MPLQTIIEHYIAEALRHAQFEQFEDGSVAARIPPCKGAVAFGPTPRDAFVELCSVMEDWVRMGMELGNPIPVLGQVDLNTEEPRRLATH